MSDAKADIAEIMQKLLPVLKETMGEDWDDKDGPKVKKAVMISLTAVDIAIPIIVRAVMRAINSETAAG